MQSRTDLEICKNSTQSKLDAWLAGLNHFKSLYTKLGWEIFIIKLASKVTLDVLLPRLMAQLVFFTLFIDGLTVVLGFHWL